MPGRFLFSSSKAARPAVAALWIIPLTLYLLTFIIVFAKSTPPWVHVVATLVTPVLVLLVLFTKVVDECAALGIERAQLHDRLMRAGGNQPVLCG